jgi:pilus assembly protein CpaB
VVAGLVLVGIGVIASILLIQRMNLPQRNAASQGETVKTNVVVITRDMFLGDKIAAADVKLAEVPVDIAPRDALNSVDGAVGKFIKTDMVSGEMVLQHNLADPTNSNHDLSFIIADDHVMMAFPASDLISTEGVIQRGDLVDIFETFQETVKTVPNGTTGTTTSTTSTTTTGTNEEQVKRTFTVDEFQKVTITALVLEVITNDNNNNSTLLQGSTDTSAPVAKKTRSYLLALSPQDALVLKHLKDTDAIFDMVLRAPTSTVQFDLTPVTEEYIIEFYGLQILP